MSNIRIKTELNESDGAECLQDKAEISKDNENKSSNGEQVVIVVRKETWQIFEAIKAAKRKTSDELLHYFFCLPMISSDQGAIVVRKDVYIRFEAVRKERLLTSDFFLEHLLQLLPRSHSLMELDCTQFNDEKQKNEDFRISEQLLRCVLKEELSSFFQNKKFGSELLPQNTLINKTLPVKNFVTANQSISVEQNKCSSSLPINSTTAAVSLKFAYPLLPKRHEQPSSNTPEIVAMTVKERSVLQDFKGQSGTPLKRPRKSTPQKVSVQESVDKHGEEDNDGVYDLQTVKGEATQFNGHRMEQGNRGKEASSSTHHLPEDKETISSDSDGLSKLHSGKSELISSPENSTCIDLTSYEKQMTSFSKVNPTTNFKSQNCFRVGHITVTKENGIYNCPFCKYSSPMATRLKRHITLHTGKEFKCTLCDRSYTEEYKLKEHIQVKHEKSVHFKCQLCYKDFTSKGGLKYHTKTTHNLDFSYWCKICQKGFNQLQYYQGHINQHAGRKPHKCNICSKEFSYIATLSAHRRHCPKTQNNTEIIKCEMCGETFAALQELNNHTRNQHFDITRFKCACGMEFRWRTSYMTHKASCSSAVLGGSDVLLKVFQKQVYAQSDMVVQPSTESKFISVNKSNDDQAMQSYTKFISTLGESKDNLHNVTNMPASSEISQHSNTNESFLRVTDTTTGKIFMFGYDNSMDNNGSNCEANNSGTVQHPSNPYRCTFCTYVTPKLSLLKQHVSIHTGKTHKCHYCSKSYTEMNKLRSHIQTKHERSLKYPCEFCDRCFTSKGGLQYHMKTIHKKDLKYKCDTCGKGFNQLHHFFCHKNTHVRLCPYVCEFCGKGFTYKFVLGSHKRVCLNSSKRDDG
ncbi:hypothetical protein CHS0354_024408 [Potamilus streckersoni]|uniref:C2H2-type domain-containing protein n=1 Tax=Potamilus streckersoni TaxID=2493646 RepID=A0AAE0SW97_9BIVA|nr:hypothetical protein CHS0354_024408 [Potamilus streckersoni]